MYIETERFGNIELGDKRILEFPLGLPGLEEMRKFIILEVDESKPLYWLQSTENKYISLPVMIPFEFLDDYYLDIRGSELKELDIETEQDLLILNVVVIPNEVKDMTANLAAPIVINVRTGIGKQIIIDAKEMPIRFPIFGLIMQKLKGGKANAGAVKEER